MTRWAPLLLLACVEVNLIPPGGAGATMKVCPSPLRLEPPPEDVSVPATITIRGNDTLVGLRWLPAQGSRLDVDVQGIGPRFVDSTGDTFTLDYALLDTLPGDTGAPLDDGVLRMFFRESEAVDLWVEVVRGDDLAALQEEQRQIAEGVRLDPCDAATRDEDTDPPFTSPDTVGAP